VRTGAALAIGAVIAVIASGPLSPLVQPAGAQTVRDVSLGFGGTVGVDHPEVYVQQVTGFWKEEGLNVSVTGQQGSTQSMQLLQAGRLDFAQITPEAAIAARLQGVPVVSVFTANKFSSKLCVPPESSIQKLSDLKGKKIGVPSATSGLRFFVQAIAKQAGLAPTDVDMLPTGFGPAAAEAMKQAQVDGLAYWSGWYIQAEGLGYKFRCYELPGLELAPGHTLVTLENTVRDKPDVVERIGRAYAKGLVYAFSHPEATVKAYWTVYPEAKPQNQPEAQALAAKTRELTEVLKGFQWDYPGWKLGHNSPQGWSALIQYLADSGQIAQSVPADKMFSNAFIDKYSAFDAAKVRSLQ
jgi:NitT/TauT family transport system substrate-binding protein